MGNKYKLLIFKNILMEILIKADSRIYWLTWLYCVKWRKVTAEYKSDRCQPNSETYGFGRTDL